MKLNDQVISPRAFALGGMLVILALLYASHAFAAECPNHCSEDRIEAYAALNADHATPVQRVERAKPILAFTIQSVGYVCDSILSMDYTDLPGAAVWHVNCNGGTLQYTVLVSAKRSVVYPFRWN
jgi:hypothetical protein